MYTLKPCPFCGSKSWELVSKHIFSDGIGHRVECNGKCHALTCWWHSKAEAIKAWNTRIGQYGDKVDDTPPQEQD